MLMETFTISFLYSEELWIIFRDTCFFALFLILLLIQY